MGVDESRRFWLGVGRNGEWVLMRTSFFEVVKNALKVYCGDGRISL